MSGHSKWASIKHKKAATDAKKGKAYTKLIKEITMAARNGGGSPDMNPALRTAMAKAKEANMPSDNVKNAVRRGTGELPGVRYETVIYEGYGPAGVAIMVEALTDNKNRASAELRNIFNKKGGNMAGAGSVNWMFNKKGYILVGKDQAKEEELMDLIIEAGAEDMKSADDESFEITTAVADLENVKKALNDKGITPKTAEMTMIPSSLIKVSEASTAKQVLGLIEALEDQDDAQQVYANFDIPDEILEKVSAE